MPLLLKLARERFSIDSPPPSATLRQLRTQIADTVHLPPDSFKLIHAGALLKDDDAPISAYSIRSNSSITILPHTPLPTKDSLPPPRDEQSIISTIHSNLAAVRDALSPAVDLFRDSPSKKEHSRLGELLLQSLLRLDGIATEPDWDHARRERKAAVREVQDLLDRLDGAWAEIQNSTR
ncbi:hypothetical protein F5887DRAFT_1071924 [Amanita rubescens]|nr:hypothetical protein F5887DRAFT_1071924 [Amanita rubescens]